MRFLASYASKGRWQALTVVAVSALLTPLLMPLSLLSGAAVALITLKVGVMQGLQLAGLSALAVGLVGMLMPAPVNGPALALTLAMLVWLPVWGLSSNLGRTADQGRVALLATLFGAMVVVAFHLSVPNPGQWWQEFAQGYFAQVTAQLSGEERAQFEANIAQTASVMTGISALGLSLSLMLSVLIGRWWQAMLVNPGGFGSEFRALRVGRKPTLLILLVSFAAMFSGGEGFGQDMLMVMMLPFMLQAVAVVHSMVNSAGASKGWLVGLYLLLVFAGPLALLLAVAGALDNWFDFRAYATPKGGEGE